MINNSHNTLQFTVEQTSSQWHKMENIVSMCPFHFVLQPSSLQHVVWPKVIILNINMCMETVCIWKTNPLLNM